jgi:hypothetical protein
MATAPATIRKMHVEVFDSTSHPIPRCSSMSAETQMGLCRATGRNPSVVPMSMITSDSLLVTVGCATSGNALVLSLTGEPKSPNRHFPLYPLGIFRRAAFGKIARISLAGLLT